MDNRRHPRLTRPFDGGWRAAWGSSACRIADISLSGCFIEAVSPPPANEAAVVTVHTADGSIEIPGRVLYVERGMGFAVKFEQLTPEQISALTKLLA